MKISIPYGSETLSVSVDDNQLIAVVEPAEVDGSVNQIPPLPFAPDLIIVNDGARPTPTEEILDAVYEQLPADSRFLVATGTHRGPTEQELERIFGKYLDIIWHLIEVHDAKDSESLVNIGVTGRGTDIYMNRLCVDAEKILVIGSVEPHYFAGYTGGRKAFLPGTTGYQSTEQNHKLALEAGSALLALAGNALHEDMMDAATLLSDKEIYSIQAVLDRHHDIYAVTAGGLEESLMAAVKKADEVFVVDVPEKADIVIAIAAAPFDSTFYQAHKAIENTKSVLKDGGVMILVAQCGEGMGNDAFVRLLKHSELPQDVIDTVKDEYKLGYHKASKLAELITKSQVWVVSELPGTEMEEIFMTGFGDVEDAIDAAIKSKGPQARILVVQDAGVTVPRV